MPTLLAILVTVVFPRLVMLNVSVIDWDESIFALIAQQWTFGHVPHETVFDHKPIGLYTIFAAFFLALGDTIHAIRLIPIVFVAGTAALLARLAQLHFGGDRWLGGFVAAIYGLMTLTNGGLATNTEILINFFVVLSIYVIVSRELDRSASLAGSLVVGASLAMAIQVNYLAVIVVAGVAGFYLAWSTTTTRVRGWTRIYRVNGSYMLAGFVLLTIIVHLPVALFGDLSDYFALKFRYLTGYPGVEDAGVAVRRVSEALTAYWPFVTLSLLLAFWAIPPRRLRQSPGSTEQPGVDRRIGAWIVLGAFALATALASRRFYQHFFLFTVPALVMLSAAFIRLACPAGRLRDFCALWLLLMAGTDALNAREDWVRGYRAQLRVLDRLPADAIAATGVYLAKHLHPGETIYVYDSEPILYFMTRTVPPTRFAFPDTHLKPEVAGRLGFTPEQAVTEILGRRPRFIVVGPRPDEVQLTPAGRLLNDALAREYAPVKGDDAPARPDIYERIRLTPQSDD